MLVSTKWTDGCCAGYEINSLGPKKSLGTNTSRKEKDFLPADKRVWPVFSHVMECDKTQRAFCEGLNGFLTLTVEGIRSFHGTYEVVGNTIFWKRNWLILLKKHIIHFFLILLSKRNLRKQIASIQRVFWQLFCKFGVFLMDPGGRLKYLVQNKANFDKKKTFWATFSRFIEHDKSLRVFYWASRGILPVFLRGMGLSL